jgi:hypothetical protein
MVHVENAVDAHLLAEHALTQCHLLGDTFLGRWRQRGRSGWRRSA